MTSSNGASPSGAPRERAPSPAFGRMMGGAPPAKPADFGRSARRLVGMLAPQRLLIGIAIGIAVASIGLSVAGPRVLGHATDLVFTGVVSRDLPAGITGQEAAEAARERGDDNLANMLEAMDLTPGSGVDFGAVGEALLWVLAIYVASAVFGYLQGNLTAIIVQRTAFRLREEVEAKLSRLPLSYFDRQPRGEVLSRATNDTDNIAQTLQ